MQRGETQNTPWLKNSVLYPHTLHHIQSTLAMGAGLIHVLPEISIAQHTVCGQCVIPNLKSVKEF